MVILRTRKQSAKLSLKTPLRPVIRTQDGARIFPMVRRYFRLLEHLDTTDDALMDAGKQQAASGTAQGPQED
ncbi:hypothetical protein PR002_g28876 [Phytophthora rubi]|uniref:Uncharacterized protein n=1 Tax=Phytophthora rubi TaxID=129364 RepID=A0A6A3H565_9STRA|nr:hypothetical protein PR002_g28876 [Phytophthora rubi]